MKPDYKNWIPKGMLVSLIAEQHYRLRCCSGALTIACAKRNPQGKMIGIDRWGKEYASFSLPLCEKNARCGGREKRFVPARERRKAGFPRRELRRGDQQLCLS